MYLYIIFLSSFHTISLYSLILCLSSVSYIHHVPFSHPLCSCYQTINLAITKSLPRLPFDPSPHCLTSNACVNNDARCAVPAVVPLIRSPVAGPLRGHLVSRRTRKRIAGASSLATTDAVLNICRRRPLLVRIVAGMTHRAPRSTCAHAADAPRHADRGGRYAMATTTRRRVTHATTRGIGTRCSAQRALRVYFAAPHTHSVAAHLTAQRHARERAPRSPMTYTPLMRRA